MTAAAWQAGVWFYCVPVYVVATDRRSVV